MSATELLAKYRAHWQAMDDASLAAEIALWEGTPRGEALREMAYDRWADGLIDAQAEQGNG